MRMLLFTFFKHRTMRQDEIKTPCYVIDAELIERNLNVLKGVSDRTGCRILLAQKAFSCYAFYPLIAQYLSGTTASGLFEAQLSSEEMPGKENHIFSPAYKESEFDEITNICGHIVFNSIAQLGKFGERAKQAGCQIGLRINPEFSTQEGHAIYDPCAPGSRLGTTLNEFEIGITEHPELLQLIDGLHFHTLCEQNSDALEQTLYVFELKFSKWLVALKWVNFGGGHHITRPDYDIPRLERCIRQMHDKYNLEVYLEPGEAIALNAGFLHTTVLEIQHKETPIAIIDASAACHMPDVLEMPYRPPLKNSGMPNEKPFNYIIGGPTCLAGDVVGTYSFDTELTEGKKLTFEDMAIYSMVKNNTFNGMPLPNIYIKQGGDYQLWKSFSYADFKSRL